MRGKSCALVALLLAGCGTNEGAVGSQSSASTAPAASATASARESAAPAAAFAQKETLGKDGTFEFAYAWPAAVSAIPALSARLDAERKADHAEAKSEWQAAHDQFPPDCVACRSRGYDKAWEVVADLPRWLSLSATFYTYTGGAHGNTVFDALVWDREQGAAIKPVDMFRSAAAIDAATQKAFCAELDKARKAKRGDAAPSTISEFNSCIAPVANSTVIIGSAGKRAFDRIGFIIPPYNAGPYAEGAYEVTLPMTPALLDAVKPEYRTAFVVS